MQKKMGNDDDVIDLNEDINILKMKFPHLFCDNQDEIKKVYDIMDEALLNVKHLCTTTENFSLYKTIDDNAHLYINTESTHDIYKVIFQINDSSKLEKLIEAIWDVNGSKKIDDTFLYGDIVRIYERNLILIKQCYKGSFGMAGRYFYVLAKKKKINDKYIIACASLNVEDNIDDNQYINPIVKSANGFSIKLNSNEKDLSFKKLFINLSGYYIQENKSNILVTYISSIQLDTALIPSFIIKKVKANKTSLVTKLKNII